MPAEIFNCGVATILLVEDEAFVREVAREVLRGAGYRVLSATDAREAAAIYAAQEHDIDLLLSDVILPGESGRELARRLRRGNPGLKVLLTTGYGEQMEAREDGEECLAKPFSSEELLGRVKKLIGDGSSRTAGPLAAAEGVQDLAGNFV